jgi:hypothetical protein
MGGAPIVEARWVRYSSATEAEERRSVAGKRLSGKLRRSIRSGPVWPRGRTCMNSGAAGDSILKESDALR